MKRRLLVMNGQRIVQALQGGAWTNEKVDKAGELRPGIYNLYSAQQADKSQRHDGLIVHADSENVYQQHGKDCVIHSRDDFEKVPEIGMAKSITYDERGKATVAVEAAKRSRRRSR